MGCFVRLACVKHAASVHPEPGSNSHVKSLISRIKAWLCDRYGRSLSVRLLSVSYEFPRSKHFLFLIRNWIGFWFHSCTNVLVRNIMFFSFKVVSLFSYQGASRLSLQPSVTLLFTASASNILAKLFPLVNTFSQFFSKKHKIIFRHHILLFGVLINARLNQIFCWYAKTILLKNRIVWFVFFLIKDNGEGGIWTLAPRERPTPLAGAPLQPLEYFSMPDKYQY